MIGVADPTLRIDLFIFKTILEKKIREDYFSRFNVSSEFGHVNQKYPNSVIGPGGPLRYTAGKNSTNMTAGFVFFFF